MTSTLRHLTIAAALLAAVAAPARAQSYRNAYVDPAALAAAAGAYSPNIHCVGSGTLRYQWQRNGLTVPLKDRNGHWTETEAQQCTGAADVRTGGPGALQE